jgi:hypothetical protein
VAEVWETQEDHDAWFEANVKPNIPFEITQEAIDLHSRPVHPSASLYSGCLAVVT